MHLQSANIPSPVGIWRILPTHEQHIGHTVHLIAIANTDAVFIETAFRSGAEKRLLMIDDDNFSFDIIIEGTNGGAIMLIPATVENTV